jgi:hypothetical protein
MSNEQLNGVPDKLPYPAALSEEEYRELMARLEAEYVPDSPEEVARQWEDVIWLRDDPNLQQRFPGKWVAVRDRQILAVGDDWQAVVVEAEQLSGLSRNKIVIAQVPSSDEGAFGDPHASDTSFPS